VGTGIVQEFVQIGDRRNFSCDVERYSADKGRVVHSRSRHDLLGLPSLADDLVDQVGEALHVVCLRSSSRHRRCIGCRRTRPCAGSRNADKECSYQNKPAERFHTRCPCVEDGLRGPCRSTARTDWKAVLRGTSETYRLIITTEEIDRLLDGICLAFWRGRVA